MSKKTKISIIIVVVFLVTIIAGVLTGCGKKEEKQIKIGLVAPLTGPAAVLGEPMLNGTKLAIMHYDSIFAARGYKIQLIPEDSQAKPALGVSAVGKLVTSDKVSFIVGPMASSVALAVLDITNSNKIVLVSPSASSPDLSKDDYFFRVELSELQGAGFMAEKAYTELGWKRMACLYVNNDYGRGTVDAFIRKFRELGGEIVSQETFEQDATDFRTILLKIQKSKPAPEAIFIVFNTEIVNIIRQMKEQDIEISVFTTPVFENPTFLEQLGKLAEGVIYTYYGEFDPSSYTKAGKKFAEEYKKHYATDATYYAALGYDATSVLLEALLASLPDMSADAVKAKLLKLQNHPGITGSISFDRNGDVSKPVIIKTVKNGQFVKLGE